jgi:hypothetical protein
VTGDVKRSRPGAGLFWVAVLLAGLFAARQLGTWPVRLRYPGEADFVEGIHLTQMQHLRQGLPVYAPASSQRFDAMTYGPLYYLLGARLINPEQPAYRPLRILSMLATLGSAAGCGLLAYWLARTYLAAVLAALIFLAYGFVIQYGASARADSLADCLFFWGFLVAYRFRDTKKVRWAIPLMLLGFYYKQLAVAGPLAVLLFLVAERRYRRAAEFAGLLAVGGVGLCLLFQFVIFRGQAFLLHFLLYNIIPWSRHAFITGLRFFGVVLAIPVVLATEYLRSYPDKLLSCYLGCACFLSLLTAGKTGSDSNFFLECALTSVVLVAALIARRIAQPGRAPELLVLLLLALIMGQFFAQGAPSAQDFSRDRDIQKFLRQNFPSHTRALGFYAGDLIRAGLDSPFSDLYQYTQLIRKGTLPDRDLRAAIEQRRFGVIVVGLDLKDENAHFPFDYYFNKSLRHAILQNYRLAASLDLPEIETQYAEDHFNVWVPSL